MAFSGVDFDGNGVDPFFGENKLVKLVTFNDISDQIAFFDSSDKFDMFILFVEGFFVLVVGMLGVIAVEFKDISGKPWVPSEDHASFTNLKICKS